MFDSFMTVTFHCMLTVTVPSETFNVMLWIPTSLLAGVYVQPCPVLCSAKSTFQLYIKVSPSISLDVWLNIRLLPITTVGVKSVGVKLSITGTSFTGVTFNVTLLLEIVRFSASMAVNIVYSTPVKFPLGVNVTIPVALLAEIVIFSAKVKLYFNESPSISEKYCVKFNELFTMSSGHFHCGIVPVNSGASLTGVMFRVILLLVTVNPSESIAVNTT